MTLQEFICALISSKPRQCVISWRIVFKEEVIYHLSWFVVPYALPIMLKHVSYMIPRSMIEIYAINKHEIWIAYLQCFVYINVQGHGSWININNYLSKYTKCTSLTLPSVMSALSLGNPNRLIIEMMNPKSCA